MITELLFSVNVPPTTQSGFTRALENVSEDGVVEPFPFVQETLTLPEQIGVPADVMTMGLAVAALVDVAVSVNGVVTSRNGQVAFPAANDTPFTVMVPLAFTTPLNVALQLIGAPPPLLIVVAPVAVQVAPEGTKPTANAGAAIPIEATKAAADAKIRFMVNPLHIPAKSPIWRAGAPNSIDA